MTRLLWTPGLSNLVYSGSLCPFSPLVSVPLIVCKYVRNPFYKNFACNLRSIEKSETARIFKKTNLSTKNDKMTKTGFLVNF